ncbi:MAG TPA: hypothetical protein VFU11_05440 [Solirubrobacterales bacterium]|nr:hypothetical protein [Solirubrobacterales bacterium]
MARIASTGGLVTVTSLPLPDEADPNIVNLSIKLFALLDVGAAVFDPRAQSQGIGFDRGSVKDLAQLEDHLLVGLRHDELPAEHRQAHWQPLLAELEKYEIHSDPETLRSLPFELVPVQAVRDLFVSQG